MSREWASVIFVFISGEPSHGFSAASVYAASARPNPGLGITELEPSVRKFFKKGLAPSTLRAYGSIHSGSAQSKYLIFCKNTKRNPLPAREADLCLFAAHLAEKGLRHQSIKSYLSAIRFLHISNGYRDPHICTMDKLESVLKGIKRAGGEPPAALSSPTHYTSSPDHFNLLLEQGVD